MTDRSNVVVVWNYTRRYGPSILRGLEGSNKTFALESAVSVPGVKDSLTIFQQILGVAKQLSETKPASVRNKSVNLSLIPSANIKQTRGKARAH